MTMSSAKETLCSQPSCPGHKVGKKGKSYALRECSIQKRKETEKRKNQPRKRGPKPRPKSAPMSKYRRKTANLRERLRMGEINTAFENLREKLPNPVQSGKGKCEKLTKINILHVAINYIRAMENLLETGDSGIKSFSEMTKNPLRDENDSKIEMQRILAVLMKKAETKAALASSGTSGSTLSESRYLSQNSKNFISGYSKGGILNPGANVKSEIKYEFDDDDDDENEEDSDLDDLSDDQEQEGSKSLTFPDWKSLSSTLVPFPPINSVPNQTFSKPNTLTSTPRTDNKSSIPRLSMFSMMTPISSSPCSFSSSTSSSPSSISTISSESGILLGRNEKTQPDPLFGCVSLESTGSGQNSDEMIKELFTDFVDIVDTLPDIDFEEHFEMFP